MDEKKTIKEQLDLLAAGESLDFPLTLVDTVRSTASLLGLKWNKAFSTRSDRTRGVVVVTRKY